jgi:hypothetical protein
MRTKLSHAELISVQAASGSMVTVPAERVAGPRRDIVSPFASEAALREIDAYVLGLRVHVRLSRPRWAGSRAGH